MGKFTNDQSSTHDFYEAIPYSSSHYIYRDDIPPTDTPVATGHSDRTFAIITLILMLIVAAAVGLLLAWGISSLEASQSSPLLQQ